MILKVFGFWFHGIFNGVLTRNIVSGLCNVKKFLLEALFLNNIYLKINKFIVHSLILLQKFGKIGKIWSGSSTVKYLGSKPK